MAILASFSTFRNVFAEHGTMGVDVGDVDFIAPDQITFSLQTWESDNFAVGQRIQPVGTTSNDQYFTIEALAGLALTTVEQDVTTEGPLDPSTFTIDGVLIDPGGFERWPVDNVAQAGFDGGITGFTIPFTGIIMTLTINSGAADAADGVDEYDWFLSQRTDDTVKQYLQATPVPPSGGNTFSGSIRISQTALADSEFGIVASTPLTPLQTVKLFNKMDLYVRRKSDGLIQWVSLLRVYTNGA